MGLYLSAHPLDKYDLYFDEQCHPMGVVCAENHGKTGCVGGIITSIRTITTKKGDKMAFVKIENKTREVEIIIFPKVYATCGAKLEVDTVIRVQGEIDAADREGNIGNDTKIKAEIVEIVSDEVLENYKATGTRLAMPWKSVAPEGPDRWRRKRQTEIDAPKVLKNIPKDPRKEKLFILMDSLNDTDLLSKIRQIADNNLGMQEVILVFYEGKEKQALKMPFKVDISSELISELKDLVGEDHLKIV